MCLESARQKSVLHSSRSLHFLGSYALPMVELLPKIRMGNYVYIAIFNWYFDTERTYSFRRSFLRIWYAVPTHWKKNNRLLFCTNLFIHIKQHLFQTWLWAHSISIVHWVNYGDRWTNTVTLPKVQLHFSVWSKSFAIFGYNFLKAIVVTSKFH